MSKLPTSESSDLSDMQVLAKLLEEESIELHTRNNGGVDMTLVDQATELIRMEFGQETYEFVTINFTDQLRRNMAAEGGWRAEQIISGVAAAVALRLNRGRSAIEDLFGLGALGKR